MIRINLIRGKRKRRREFRTENLVLVIPLVVLAGLFVHERAVSARIRTLRAETDRASVRIEQLKKQIGEVEKFKARKAELQKKVDIISNLQTGRTGPVRILDLLAAAVPAKCWIEQLAFKGNRIELTGMAINNDAIANFMTALQQSGTFRDVVLGSADQATVMNAKLMKFNLTFSVVPK